MLTEQPCLRHDREIALRMFSTMALESPDVESEDPGKINPISLMDQQQTPSSAGLLPLNTLFGNVVGSKKDM